MLVVNMMSLVPSFCIKYTEIFCSYKSLESRGLHTIFLLLFSTYLVDFIKKLNRFVILLENRMPLVPFFRHLSEQKDFIVIKVLATMV